MIPIGPLMVEHRWIERLIADLDLRLSGRSGLKTIGPAYVDSVVDFFRAYADRCHHGKEEDILFRELSGKDLEPGLATIMRQLVAEHSWARGITREVVAANASFAQGDEQSLGEVRRLLGDLAAFYPRHIAKEDEQFFRPAMAYLTAEEQQTMLDAFAAFDASLVHERYRGVVEELERRT